MKSRIQILKLPDGGSRGENCFTVPPLVLSCLGQIRDIYIAPVAPGAIRGNHFHLRRKEALIILYETEWVLYWDEGENTPTCQIRFLGAGARVILVEPGSSHAVRNTGTRELLLLGLFSESYDPTESLRRELISVPALP